MSIINDALKKAHEERDRGMQRPRGAPEAYPAKAETLQKKTKTEAPPSAPEKARGAAVSKKITLRYISLIIAAVVLISFTLPMILKQDIKNAVSRFLPLPEKEKTAALSSGAAQPQPLAEVPGAPLPELPEFVVTGIVYGEGSPMAVINGAVYMAGDKVGAAKVLEITKDMVVLEKDGEKIELKVK